MGKVSCIKFDGKVKGSSSRRRKYRKMRNTWRTLQRREMSRNTEIGLFTKPSSLTFLFSVTFYK